MEKPNSNQNQSSYHEPEEVKGNTQNAEVIPDQDMLTEHEIIDRAHARGGNSGGTVPEWTPPAYTPTEEENQEGGETQNSDRPEGPMVNEGLYDLPEGDKREGAEYMADMAFGFYGETKRELGNAMIPIKTRRLIKLEEKGLINLDIPLPARDGGYIDARGHIERYNAKAYDVFGLRENFVREVRPILVKEFAKKGIGLTPWQRVLFAVGMDLKEDIKIGMQLKGTANEIIDALKEATKAYKESGSGGGFAQASAAAPGPVASAQNFEQQSHQAPVPGPEENPIPNFAQQQESKPVVNMFTASPTDQFNMMQAGLKQPLPPSAIPNLSNQQSQNIHSIKNTLRRPRKRTAKKAGGSRKKTVPKI